MSIYISTTTNSYKTRLKHNKKAPNNIYSIKNNYIIYILSRQMVLIYSYKI